MGLSSYNIDEIKALIVMSNDDLKSSKNLFEIGQYRNSVVLSYYSMYSIARALLLIKGSEPSTHSGLIGEFGRLYVLEEGFDKKLASEFSNARVSRENASYATVDTFNNFDSESAEYNIDLAERFRDEAKKFFKKFNVDY
jgi:uncharacterized protein (UPF0332 family)